MTLYFSILSRLLGAIVWLILKTTRCRIDVYQTPYQPGDNPVTQVCKCGIRLWFKNPRYIFGITWFNYLPGDKLNRAQSRFISKEVHKDTTLI